MNRVAAKIAKEIAVFFQHRHVDSGAREQITNHHPRGSSTHYHAARSSFRIHVWISQIGISVLTSNIKHQTSNIRKKYDVLILGAEHPPWPRLRRDKQPLV